ncbi:conserved exported hypothetical protein [Burkholderia sp. 8Y]|uniref:hypothetical protein n=1 Tax=Burkholderia sp. 8Y TaxID=2653133 RepID=UPI0012F1463E|nr:hypothetical protein [Burkholderia sp. 8Y]VXB26110.1 conserved exported hypothetical protein [Burkholderia sp. 8Y]
MKNLMLLAAGLVALVAILAGCSQAQLQATQTAAQKLQSDVTLACNVLQPAIAPYAILLSGNTAVDAFNADAALACSANVVLNLTSVENVIYSSAAAAQGVVSKLPGLTETQVAMINSFIGAFQGSLNNAVAIYKASRPAETAAPASAASGAIAS